jgi:GcrA cell cycle regulator
VGWSLELLTEEIRLRETEKKIIAKWKDGKTTSQIGADLGVTKSTISGILARLRAKGVDVGREKDERKCVKSKEARAAREEAIRNPPPPPAPPPEVGRLTIMDLKKTTCRWPYGDARKEGVTYCGSKVMKGCVYCEAHRLKAISPYIPRGLQTPA